MVVCKFFQEGNCRYGQNCRFEHIYGSKYSYHANAPAQAAPAPQASGGVTDDQLIEQVRTDIQSALNGRQWLLSCYAPHKEKPNFPGLSDLSPEEARLFIYEAKANNNVEQAVAYMNNLTKEARSKYEQVFTGSPTIIKVIRSLYKGERPASPFTTGQAQNIFGSQSQNSQTSASSLFRSANQTVQNTSFAQPFGQPSQSVFGAQSPPSQNFFGAADSAKSIFAQANKSSLEASRPASQPFRSPFEQPSPFAQNNVARPTSVFGAPNVFQQTPADDPGVYSNVNDVSPEDMEMFKAENFKLGFIPEIPPPHSLCV